jgi:hypothetical protein
MSAQAAAATSLDAAKQPPKINDVAVWLLIAVPFVGPLAERLSGVTLSVWTYVIVNSVLMLLDSRQIARGERTDVRLGRWIWLAPVYLFRRARALQASQRYLMAWVAAFFAGIIASSDISGAWNSYWGYGAPACEGWYARTRIVSLFDTIPVIRDAAIEAARLRPEGEISLANDTRICRGTIEGKDGKAYPVIYSFQWTADWGVRPYVRLAPAPKP